MRKRGRKQDYQPGEKMGDWHLIARAGVLINGGHVVWDAYSWKTGEIAFVTKKGSVRRVAEENIIWPDEERGFQSWKCMLDRCYSSRINGFFIYGGRELNPIRVWTPWRPDFHNVFSIGSRCKGSYRAMRGALDAFFGYMGLPPDDAEYNIDRINPRGDYVPGNVRWIRRDLDGPGCRDDVLARAREAALADPSHAPLEMM